MISCAKNDAERNSIVSVVKKYEKRIGIVKGKIYDYVLKIYNQLAYSNTVEDIFNKKYTKKNVCLYIVIFDFSYILILSFLLNFFIFVLLHPILHSNYSDFLNIIKFHII